MIHARPSRHGLPPAGVDFALLANVEGPLGLCVSGGSDSVALATLLSRYAPRAYTILTVDHGLRPGSRADADFVAALGARLGLPVERLVVPHPPRGSLQSSARSARYDLFRDASRRLGLVGILTGHTLEDQAETVLLRLARGSGLKGLAAMRPSTRRDGLLILRPLLGAKREDLRAYLTADGLSWREDPSNADPKFDRVAMRNLAPRLAAVGLTAERLAGTAAHLARASDAIEARVSVVLEETARIDRAGAVLLNHAGWAGEPEEVRLRALARVLAWAGGMPLPPRFAALTRAERAIQSGRAATVGRACLAPLAGATVLWRENRHIEPLTVSPGTHHIFDGRYHVCARRDAPTLTVAAADGLRLPSLAQVWRPAIASTPAVFRGGQAVAVPTLGMRRRDFAKDTLRFAHVR